MTTVNCFTESEQRDGFAIRYLPGKGRHLVAVRSFAPGAVILQQDPYASVLSDERTPGHCDLCFRCCERPLRCSRSKLARYCSKEHQRMAWSSGYKIECEALVRCAPRVPPPTVRLAARILWRRARALQQRQDHQQQQQQQQQQAAGDELHEHHQPPWDSDHEGLWRLEHHWDKLDNRRKGMYAQMAVVTWQYMYGTPDGPVPADGDAGRLSGDGGGAAAAPAAAAAAWPGTRAVAELLSRLACNCHTVCDEELRPLGVALYPTGALVNHSCTPNAVQGFRGSTLQLRALRPLAPGDEVTIAYVELAATRQERQETLADSYFFDINSAVPPAVPSAPPAGPPSAAPASGDAGAGLAMEVDDDVERVAAGLAGAEGTGSKTATPIAAYAAADGDSGDACCPAGLRPPPVLSLEVAANARLHVYSPLSEQPPWPVDECDSELTRVLLSTIAAHVDADAAAVGSSGGGGSDEGAVVLRGGLLARLVPRRPNEPEEEEDGEEDEEEVEEEGSMEAAGMPGAAQHPDTDMSDAAGAPSRPDTAEAADRVASTSDASCSGIVDQPPKGQQQQQQQHQQHEPGGTSDGGGSGARGSKPSLRLQLPSSAALSGAAVRMPRIELLAWGPWVAELVRTADGISGPLARHPVAMDTAAGETAAGETAAGGRGGGGRQAHITAEAAQQQLSQGTSGPGTDASAGVVSAPPYSAVAGLLRRCVRALQLSHQAADAAAAAACGGEGTGELQAVELLQRALALLDRQPSPPQQRQQQDQPRSAADCDCWLVLGPNNALRVRLLAQLLKAAVDHGSAATAAVDPATAGQDAATAQGAWQVALRAARTLEAPYRLAYPQPGWPNLSLHFATLAKLEMLLGRPRRAQKAAAKALSGLRLTHVGGGGGGGGGGCDGGSRGGGEGEGVVDQVVRVGREAEAELRAREESRAPWGQGGASGCPDDDDDDDGSREHG